MRDERRGAGEVVRVGAALFFGGAISASPMFEPAHVIGAGILLLVFGFGMVVVK